MNCHPVLAKNNNGVCPLCPVVAPPAIVKAASVSPAQLRAHVLGARAELCKKSLAEFVRYSWHVLEPGAGVEWGWHIEAIANHVQWQLEDRARATQDPAFTPRAGNLLVNIPPRCLKSRIISVCATAWAWLHWPHMRILALSVNPRVSFRDADATRQLIRSNWYQESFKPKWSMREDKTAVSSFANTTGGQRDARGFTSQIVGEGADWIIVDDPNDAQEVYSEVTRNGVNERWDNAIANRVNNPRTSIRTGVMQRVHEGDWSGHILAQGGWDHLCLPMEFEPERAKPTPFGWTDPRTEPGQVLHARFTPSFLAAERVRLGSIGYAGQMQQRPSPAEGGLFKRQWWRWWRPEEYQTTHARPMGCLTREASPAVIIPPKGFDWIAISVDAAFKATDSGSRVGMLVIGGRKADRFVITDRTRPMTFTETCAMIRALKAEYPTCTRIIIEKKANGDAIIDTLMSEVTGIIGIEPAGGKESRAAAISPACESGNVYLLDGASWADDFVGELGLFPNGSHDDRVDALSQCLIHMGMSPDMARALMLCS